MKAKLKKINNIRILRSQTKKISLKILEKILKKFKIIVNERRKKEVKLQEEIKKKNKKLNYYRKMLLADGINLHELLNKKNLKKNIYQKNKIIHPAKYKYLNKKGEMKTWTGKGRTPTVIKNAILNKRKNLKDFLL
ncbi:H-NS family nucleoid-associated regulatory protein [Buchnera aphidicola]|uniref:H-NS family histone-like protein n=1 Tax=Buchnera aphidicola TaxID=9 RepID=UPI0031B6739E